MDFPRALLAAVSLLAVLPASAGVLYKSIGPNGSVMFSDMPPTDGARVVEQRVMRDDGKVLTTADSMRPGGAVASGYSYDADPALERANQDVDMAEHALALARRDLWSARDGLRLGAKRLTRADEDRVEFYQRGVATARKALIALLRERQATPAEPGAPRVVSGPGQPLLAALVR